MVDTKEIIRRFDTNPHPNVWWPRQRVRELEKPLRTLGEDLVCVPVCTNHYVENSSYFLSREVFMKQVAHRVYENELGLFPFERLEQSRLPELNDPEGVLVFVGGGHLEKTRVH